jgi:putative transposase
VTVRRRRPAPPAKLTAAEAEEILATPRSPRLVGRSPARVYFTVLDEGTYLAPEPAFYRVPRAHDSATKRRRQATHPPRTRPELVAHGLLVVWPWDITKLPGPRQGDSCDLYVVIGIFSRYAVAWCVAASEDGELARELIADAVARHQVPPGTTDHPPRPGLVDDAEPGNRAAQLPRHQPLPQLVGRDISTALFQP